MQCKHLQYLTVIYMKHCLTILNKICDKCVTHINKFGYTQGLPEQDKITSIFTKQF